MAGACVIAFTMVADFFKDAINQLKRGENSYKSHNVQSLVFDTQVKSAVLKGTVAASMKKKIYTVEASIDVEGGAILSMSCTCPRGLAICHHMAALCIHAHHNVSVTDQPCAWSVPRQSAGDQSTQSISELYPKKNASYRAINSEEVSEENVKSFLTKLGTGNLVGYSWLLRETAREEVAEILVSVEELVFSQEYVEAPDKDLFIINKCRLTAEQIEEVVKLTVGQTNNENWLIARKHRLTASNFGVVLAAIRRQRYPPSLFKRLMDGYNLSSALAVQWGKEHEAAAIETFSAAFPDKEVTPTGFWLEESGVLGASPDGLCGESIIEVKCPYKYRSTSLQEALTNDSSYIIYKVGNDTVINENHDYYHQIQGQLHITKRDSCYLIVWTPNECEVVLINKDEEWSSNLDSLRTFYIEQLVPFISGINK